MPFESLTAHFFIFFLSRPLRDDARLVGFAETSKQNRFVRDMCVGGRAIRKTVHETLRKDMPSG